ncbi:zinc finger MYM-type protein 5-like [Schistocerca piceifrons]|uniref:zinc finger MYM-type protein 5-like n=1 Tax=Schistocerca piceifrons TaxID=274613 RepID=UPI001F5EC9EA|nr:zinc finger MYM-type protein 5-like [Schistocerca piceifrons]
MIYPVIKIDVTSHIAVSTKRYSLIQRTSYAMNIRSGDCYKFLNDLCYMGYTQRLTTISSAGFKEILRQILQILNQKSMYQQIFLQTEQLYTKNIQSPIEGDQIDQRSTSLHESSDISPSQNQHMTSVVDESINVLAIKEYNDSDVGTWPKVLNARDIDRIIICGPSPVCLNNFPKDENGRHFSSTHYARKLSNEETIRQRWLVYSVTNDSVFCFCCRLIDLKSTTNLTTTVGFRNWKHLSEALKLHENSPNHKKAFTQWTEAEIRFKAG